MGRWWKVVMAVTTALLVSALVAGARAAEDEDQLYDPGCPDADVAPPDFNYQPTFEELTQFLDEVQNLQRDGDRVAQMLDVATTDASIDSTTSAALEGLRRKASDLGEKYDLIYKWIIWRAPYQAGPLAVKARKAERAYSALISRIAELALLRSDQKHHRRKKDGTLPPPTI